MHWQAARVMIVVTVLIRNKNLGMNLEKLHLLVDRRGLLVYRRGGAAAAPAPSRRISSSTQAQ